MEIICKQILGEVFKEFYDFKKNVDKFWRNMGGLKFSSLKLPANQLFAVSSANTDFPKKLFNMKIFSIKFGGKNLY